MKKAIFLALAVICIAALVACNQNPATGGTNPETTLPTAERQYANNLNANGYIGEEAAKEIALNHAGLTADKVTFVKGELENENGTVIYEIEFYRDGNEYDYEINADNGSIIKFDSDAEAQTLPVSTVEYITLDEAKAIALNHAGFAEADITFIKGELENDDGTVIYEIEFFRDSAEYDYEINAADGSVVEFDADIEAEILPATVPETIITLDEAKTAVLTHAGLTADEVTFIKGELEKEDGTVIYEIEFYRDATEYDYEINAADGSVIKFDSDAEAQTLPPESQNLITLDEAKAIALSHAGLAETDVDFIKGELDIDDGKAEYEIEFYRGNAEFDYEIDAASGAVVGYDYEVEAELPPQSPAAGTSTVITPEEAKAIALQHAGLSEADVTRLKVKTDHDDGMTVYEIEFKKGFTEYEYEINAADGAIIEYEAD